MLIDDKIKDEKLQQDVKLTLYIFQLVKHLKNT